MYRRLPLHVALLLVMFTGWAAPAFARDCVGVVAASVAPFWVQVEAGARQAAREQNVDVYYRAPRREGRIETQLQMIDRALEQGCKALVIAPSGLEIAPRVAQLASRGINTIFFDRELPSGEVRAVVATDNFRAGVEAGQTLAQALGGQGQVALLRLQADVPSTSERERGFSQGAVEGGLTILVDAYIGDDSQAAASALREHLPQLSGVFTPNSNSSRAALAALRRLGKAGVLLHVGFDGDALLIDAVRKGDIHALFIQQAHAIGYRAVQLAAQGLRGELPPTRVDIPLPVREVNRNNLVQWELDMEREMKMSANP